MNCARDCTMKYLVWLFTVTLGFALTLSSTIPRWSRDVDEEQGNRSLRLVAKNAEYWRSVRFDDGTLPAWLGLDGLMRVPRPSASAPFTADSVSSPSALSLFIDRYYGDVFPAADFSRSRDSDVGRSARIEEFVPRLARFDSFVEPARQTTSPCSVDSSTCRDCYQGYLTPTLTNPDGSDIFRYDLFDPSPSYPAGLNYSEDSLAPECSFQDEPPGYLVCSDRTLTKVPRLPREKLSIFELNDTSVTALTAGGFDGVDVVVMRLDGNSIAGIEHGAFGGISNLLTLSIENNEMASVDWRVFDGLGQLVVLSLRNNRIDLSRVGKDVPPHQPNATGALLPRLAYLNLAENPLGELHKYVFWTLGNSSIEDLNLKSCNISAIHPEAFEPLKHLSHVDLFNNPLLMHNAEQAALHLPSHQLQIGLGANRLFQGLPNSLISNASASIVALNLSGNLLFLLTNALFSSLQMPMLATLILESCSVSLVEPGAFRSLPNLTSLYLGKNQLNAIAANALPPSLTLLSLNRNPQRSGDPFKMTDDNLAHLKRLHWLDISYMNIEDMTPNVLNGLGNLLVLQIRGSGLTSIPGGLFTSLSNLLVLDLGENALHTLPNEFSTGLERTRMLFLDRCELDFSSNGEENATTHNDTEELYQPFREMKALELLYLHSNNIRHFSASLVANLTNLRVLYLRGNLLQTWESGTTAFMPREAAIDASNNRITILPNYTFEEFDRISAVDLSDNALTCNCETYDLKRLASEESNAIVCYWDKPFAYTCTDTVVRETPVIKEISEMDESEFHCDVKPSAVGYAIGAMAGLVVLLLVVASVCYYKRVAIYRRWFVYWHGRAARGSQRRKLADENGNRFEYDAFISFNENDRPWVYTHLVPYLERGKGPSVFQDDAPSFRLCLHDRDFTAGQRITENIVDNISKSRKVVIVLSRSYVESKWCQFELHLSQHRLLESERRDDLILIVLEDVPKQQLDVGLRYLMRTRTYLAWRSDVEGQRTFWKRLRHDLTDGCSPQTPGSSTQSRDTQMAS